MKPTPGPYFIAGGEMKKASGPVVSGDDGTTAIAMFLDFGIGPEQARANAEAWIVGMEAMEKLRRMRALYVDKRDDELFSVAIEVKHILDEP